jgi:hypothetical protein
MDPTGGAASTVITAEPETLPGPLASLMDTKVNVVEVAGETDTDSGSLEVTNGPKVVDPSEYE